jgi:hypothetical protein
MRFQAILSILAKYGYPILKFKYDGKSCDFNHFHVMIFLETHFVPKYFIDLISEFSQRPISVFSNKVRENSME